MQVSEELFASKGFAGASTQEIAEKAGLTRGAVYFHFTDKKALFRAVFENLEARLMARLGVGAAAATSAWDGLVLGCRVYLDSCLEESFSRTVFLDAPAVLGWEQWREVEEQHALGAMRSALQACIDERSVRSQPVPPLAQLLLACLTEAGMLIARANDKALSRRELGEAVAAFLRGLSIDRDRAVDV